MVAAKRRFFDDNGFGVSPLKPAITAMLMFHPNLKPFCYNKLSCCRGRATLGAWRWQFCYITQRYMYSKLHTPYRWV